MYIRGYILGVVLLALVGWCMVEEAVGQTRSRYHLAELTQREQDVKKRLEQLRTREEALRSPARLAAVVREKKMDLVSLGSVQPSSPAWEAASRRRMERRPGEVLDETYTDMLTGSQEELAHTGRQFY